MHIKLSEQIVRHNQNETEMKLKRNWNKTAVKRFRCFSQSQVCIRRLCKTAVYDAVNQTLVNKHGDHMRY